MAVRRSESRTPSSTNAGGILAITGKRIHQERAAPRLKLAVGVYIQLQFHRWAAHRDPLWVILTHVRHQLVGMASNSHARIELGAQ
eukprot:4198411-Amphidinium_carterae.1